MGKSVKLVCIGIEKNGYNLPDVFPPLQAKSSTSVGPSPCGRLSLCVMYTETVCLSGT